MASLAVPRVAPAGDPPIPRVTERNVFPSVVLSSRLDVPSSLHAWRDFLKLDGLHLVFSQECRFYTVWDDATNWWTKEQPLWPRFSLFRPISSIRQIPSRNEMSPCGQAERCGWQVGAQKFLWNGQPQAEVEPTTRGFLGRGAVGEVEEVKRPGWGAHTMVRKRIRLSSRRDETAAQLKNAKKEIEAMKFLSHWHIVQILGCYGQNTGPRDRLFHILMHPVGDNDLATFLLEEFAQGDTPTKTLYRGWIEQWFLCLASALTYMHSEKVHHEDIKPSNIIHCGSRILFTDFSSSRRITAEDSTSTESSALASRMYAAPEAIPDYTNGIILRHGSRTDVFSLGLVFVEMLTVCVGESVEELRKYLFENTEGHDTQGRRQYHRAMPRLSTWFLGTIGEKMWSHLLRPMLRHERSDRPSAEEVFKRLSIEWRSQPTCTCHYDLPASAYIDTAQQDMKAVHESSLEDWVYIEKKPVNI